jgi:hypothetical protein
MDDAPLLRLALRANALFSALTGGLAVGEAEPVARLVSLPEWAITELGLVLVGYGVALMVLSRRQRVASSWTVVATLLDFAWVAGSALFLALRDVRGPLLVAAPAVVVLVFAVLQLEGLRRATSASDSRSPLAGAGLRSCCSPSRLPREATLSSGISCGAGRHASSHPSGRRGARSLDDTASGGRSTSRLIQPPLEQSSHGGGRRRR